MVFALLVRQGVFAFAFLALEFKEEDRSRTHERQIASDDGVRNLAVIFALGMISAVMLFGFNRPIPTDQLQELLRIGLVCPKARHEIGRFVSGFDHAAFAQGLSLAIYADDLSGAGQPHGRPIDLHDPEPALFDASMSLIERLSLRGERRLEAAVLLLRARWVDCL